MKPKTPEGTRYLRSDGTPNKATRRHKEENWIKYAKSPEEVHSPQANLRAIVLELLNSHFISNVILADGDKYVGVARLPKIAASIALWHERDAPVYEILLEPVKRVEEKLEPIDSEMSDKEVKELLKSEPLLDLYPVTEEGKIVASLPVREVLATHLSELPAVQLRELSMELPSASTLGEALMLMNEKALPVVLVGDKVIKARDVLARIWQERRKSVSDINFEDLLKEAHVFNESVTLRDAIELVKPEADEGILISVRDEIRYVPWSVVFAQVI